MYLGSSFQYGFLQGTSTNTQWVNGFQDRFNKGPLAQSFAIGNSDPAGATAILAPAFAQIQADAENFIASQTTAANKSAAADTIFRWKNSDFPMIQGALNDWAARLQAGQPAAVVAAPAGSTSPSGLPIDTAVPVYASQPAIYSPSIPSTAPAYSPGAPVVNVSTGAPADLSAQLQEYLPWIAGAALVGLLISSGNKKRTN